MLNSKLKVAAFVVLTVALGILYVTQKKSIFDIKNSTLVNGTNSESISLSNKEFKLFDKQILRPEALANKIVILNFWASWCGPCIEEVPSMIELTKRNKNIAIIAVSGDSNEQDISNFMKNFPDFDKKPIYQVWDQNKKIIDSFGVRKLPESYIFNSKGEMVKHISGSIDWNTIESIEFFKSM